MPLHVPKPVVGEKIKAKPCKACGKGSHRISAEPCREPCTCWCRRLGPAIPFLPPPAKREWRYADLTSVFATLIQHRVICRADSNGKLLWKPKPSELPEEVAALIREHKLLLALALAPYDEPNLKGRHWWSHGGVKPCVGCGRGCVTIDPLGEPRHYWCGWVKQLVPQY